MPRKRHKIYLNSKHGVTFECCMYPKEEVEHRIFDNKEDFEYFFMQEQGAIPKFEDDWRVAKEGSWTYADDGRVLQILRRRPIKHQSDSANWKFAPNGSVMTIVGTFIANRHYWMDTDFTLHRGRSSFSNKRTSEETVEKRNSPTTKEMEFVLCLIRGDSLLTAYKKIYGTKSRVTAMRKATFLIRQERIMRLLKEKLDDAATKLNIDVEYIMSGIKRMADSHKTPATVKLEAYSRLGKYIGMEDEENTGAIPLTGYNSQKEELGEHGGETIKLDRPDLPSFNPDEFEPEVENVIDGRTGEQI